MIYCIPALNFDNEFVDIDYVGRYVDTLIGSTGSPNYAIVYRWDGDICQGPPDMVLFRIPDGWGSRKVIVTSEEKGEWTVDFSQGT